MSSGGGGDGGAAARQQQIERQKQLSRDQVNALFGNAPNSADLYTTTTKRVTGRTSATQRNPDGEDVYDTTTALDPTFNDLTTKATTNKAARQALYDTVRQNAFDAGKTGLDENKTNAARNTKFSLFAQGLNGGSEDINQNALLDRTYNKGLLDLGAKADATRTDMQSNDEKTRLGLLQSIDSGVDQSSAISSAINQMQTNADRAASEAQGNTLGDLFAESGLLYNKSKAAQGRQAANAAYPYVYPASGGASLGSSGTVTSDYNRPAG